jgi:hypothetical protein
MKSFTDDGETDNFYVKRQIAPRCYEMLDQNVGNRSKKLEDQAMSILFTAWTIEILKE